MSQEIETIANESAESKPKARLWNPSTADTFGLFLFSPIFTAWIQALNWLELGRPEKAKKTMYWAYAGIAVVVLLVLSMGMLLPLGLGFLIAWHFSSREQVKLVEKSTGDDYEWRSWGKPILYGLAGWGVFLVAGGFLFIIVTALASMFAPAG